MGLGCYRVSIVVVYAYQFAPAVVYILHPKRILSIGKRRRPNATANISGSRTVLQSPVYEGGVVVGAELVESGIAPDIALERQYFYNDASLVDAIQKGADQ